MVIGIRFGDITLFGDEIELLDMLHALLDNITFK